MMALEELKALVLARRLLDGEVERAAERALVEGESRSEVARCLGISRAGLYRRFLPGSAPEGLIREPDDA